MTAPSLESFWKSSPLNRSQGKLYSRPMTAPSMKSFWKSSPLNRSQGKLYSRPMKEPEIFFENPHHSTGAKVSFSLATFWNTEGSMRWACVFTGYLSSVWKPSPLTVSRWVNPNYTQRQFHVHVCTFAVPYSEPFRKTLTTPLVPYWSPPSSNTSHVFTTSLAILDKQVTLPILFVQLCGAIPDFFKTLASEQEPWWASCLPRTGSILVSLCMITSLLPINSYHPPWSSQVRNPSLKGLSHEIDFKNFDQNWKNLA